MKRPQPDLGQVLLQDHLGAVKGVRDLHRNWGTETLNGVEVLKRRQYYFPNSRRDDNFERLFRLLGSYNNVVDSNPEGVESAWAFLNRNLGTALESYEGFVTTNLNKVWDNDIPGPVQQGTYILVNFVVGGLLTSGLKTPIRGNRGPGKVTKNTFFDGALTHEDRVAVLNEQSEAIWDTASVTQEGMAEVYSDSGLVGRLPADDPWASVLARYAVFSFTSTEYVTSETSFGVAPSGDLYPTVVFTAKIPHVVFTENNPLVQRVALDITQKVETTKGFTFTFLRNEQQTKAELARERLSNSYEETLLARDYLLWQDAIVALDEKVAALWYKFDGSYYLRAEPFINPRLYGFTFKEFNTYVLSTLDSSYKKESVAWYKKLVAAILFVVAIIFAIPSGGASLNLIPIAAAILVASLILTLFTLALSALGYHEWASAFMSVNRAVEPLTWIASVITLTVGIQDGIKAAAKQAAKEAGKALAEVTVQEILVEFVKGLADDLVGEIIKGAKDAFAGNITAASLKFTETLVKAYTTHDKNKLEALSSKNRDLQSEYEQLSKELNQEQDILQAFSRLYSKPATADWSMYAEQFDMPYERGGGHLAIGNIQRTTKQALRRGTYTDSVFDDILVV